MAADDVAFAYIKATEGGDFVDARFVSNWEGSAGAGIHRGAYHFFTRCRSGEAQAAHFIDVVPDEPGALPPALDLEHMGPCQSLPTREDIVADTTVFLDRVEAHYGRRPIVYTTEWFHNRHLTRMQPETFWLRSMLTPPGFREDEWMLWQHSATGQVRGVAGNVDLNVFRGDSAAFAAWADGAQAASRR